MLNRWLRAALCGCALLILSAVSASAAAPNARLGPLQRGVNITGWFRYPLSRDPASLARYADDATLRELRAAGFTFVRLPFDPAFGLDAELRRALLAQARRIEKAGLAVVLVPASAAWRLETRPDDRTQLRTLWTRLAPELRGLPRTFPEIVNEPVFAGQAAEWQALQAGILGAIRAALPDRLVVLSGPDWSSIGGLAATVPVADRHVAYTVHFYDPPELTSLAAYRPRLDHAAFARLPFPMDAAARCRQAVRSADPDTESLAAFVCGQGWDAARIRHAFDRVASWSRRAEAPVLLGEFGASEKLNPAARLAWIAAVRSAATCDGLGWAIWGLDDSMGFALKRPLPSRLVLDPGLLGALGLTEDHSKTCDESKY